MAVEIDASSEALDFADPPFLNNLSACTFAFTVVPREDPAVTLRLFHQWDNTDDDRSFLIYTTAADTIFFALDDDAGGTLWQIRTTAAQITSGTLIRVVCRKDSSAGVGCAGGDIWVTGGGSSPVACTQVSTGVHVATPDSGQPMSVGRQTDFGSACMLGEYSEIAVWNAEIPDWVAEAYCEHGMSPAFWPHNLVFYDPLWNLNHLVDRVGGIVASTAGTPVDAIHPGVLYPEGYLIQRSAGIVVPDFFSREAAEMSWLRQKPATVVYG